MDPMPVLSAATRRLLPVQFRHRGGPGKSVAGGDIDGPGPRRGLDMGNGAARAQRLVMIATKEPRRGSAPLAAHTAEREVRSMESLSAGTFVGSGSFRCQRCGYALTLEGSDVLTPCPSCGGQTFLRASLFSTERISQSEGQPTEATLVQAAASDM